MRRLAPLCQYGTTRRVGYRRDRIVLGSISRVVSIYADFRKSLTLLISAHFRALSVPTFGVIVELRCINASTNKSIPGGSQHDDEIPSSHNWHYRKGDFWGLCSCMTGTLLVYGKVNLNETTLDNTWRAVGLIGSKSLEIGADSTCENRRSLHVLDGARPAGILIVISIDQHLPITKARINLGAVVKQVHLNKEYVILEKDGIPIAALMDVDEFEATWSCKTRR